MQFQRHALGLGLVAMLVLLALGTPAAASPAETASNAAPVVGALDDVSVIDTPSHHCDWDESHVDQFTCIYNPPCDATCVDIEAVGAAYAR